MPNRLADEKSPYLKQHQFNPVNWYSWGSEAFEAAEREQKPIFLSIGYSTCYWCHVMEKDSFEHQHVADVLNEHFISIKLDREERPDIDSIYMDIVVGMSGHGGWPMSVFLTPKLEPFFGGTFFPQSQFISLLNGIAAGWKRSPEEVKRTARDAVAFLQNKEGALESLPISSNLLVEAFNASTKQYDSQNGGFGTKPKFPPCDRIRFLMRYARRSNNRDALDMALQTLSAIAFGGIYDHLGGGIHRYSTDSEWLIPHFEKMLYDNALFLLSNLEAYQASGDPLYLSVSQETLNYLLRDMKSPLGAFYSAEDAGEVGREGEFYTWSQADLEDILDKEDMEAAEALFGVSTSGNFEHSTNILHVKSKASWLASRAKQNLREKLFSARLMKERPHRDEKILTSWNALTANSLLKAFQVTGQSSYLSAAVSCLDFLRTTMLSEDCLYRRFSDGEVKHRGVLDDYAFFVQASITAFESTGHKQWLELALSIQSLQDKLFGSAGAYFFSDDSDGSLIVRQKELADGAEPAGNGVAALNLLKLWRITKSPDFKNRACAIFEEASAHIAQYPGAYSSMLIALDFLEDDSSELVYSNASDPLIYSDFLPNTVLIPTCKDSPNLEILRDKVAINGQPAFYVCHEGRCSPATTSLAEAVSLISKRGIDG